MNSSIILIGPIGAGKSTIGRLLAEKLELPLCSIDNVRALYYAKLGYDQALAEQIAAEQGIQGVLRYAEPFDAQMITMVLADYPHSLIDFGASNSIYNDQDILAQVENILTPYPYVILLLPSPDLAESAEILQERLIQMLTAAGKTFTDELFALNSYFIQHPANQRLAKQVVYAKGKTPETICAEIVGKLV